MQLMTPERWLDRYFEEGSRPSMQVLQRLMREGKLPGRKVGGAGTSTNTSGSPAATT